MAATSRGRRRHGAGLSVALGVLLAMAAVVPAQAATVGATLRAQVGSSGANGTATIQAFTSGSGSLTVRLARLKASASLPIAISRGTCASAGALLITLPAIRTTSSGTAARTSGLTVAQVTKLKAAMNGVVRIAIRVGSPATGGARCGDFTVSYVPIGIVLPADRVGDQARFQDALATAGYGARILLSRDTATELADVRSLIRLGIKVLIIGPQDSTAAAAAAAAARAAGARVIDYGRLIRNTASVDYFVDVDRLAVGAAQAQYLIDRAGATKGNNLYLYAGAASDDNSFAFFEGAWERLQPRIADGTFVIRNSGRAVALQGVGTLTRDQETTIFGQITTNWDVSTARTLAVGNLAAAPSVAKGTVFVLAPNDATAGSILDAFRADGDVSTYYVTGQDADKASVQSIIDGGQGMTVFKDARVRVRDALAAAVAMLQGGTPEAVSVVNNGTIDVPAMLAPIVSVTLDNVQSALIDSGYYRASDFTGSWPGKP